MSPWRTSHAYLDHHHPVTGRNRLVQQPGQKLQLTSRGKNAILVGRLALGYGHRPEIAMGNNKLTREEIALSILNGIIGSLFTQAGSQGALSLLQESKFGANTSREAIDTAFQMADSFIQKRDEAS
jgi:hypothetical protein